MFTDDQTAVDPTCSNYDRRRYNNEWKSKCAWIETSLCCLAHDDEVLLRGECDAVGEGKAAEHHRGRLCFWVVLEEPSSRPGLENVEKPIVEPELTACVAEVDAAVGSLRQVICESAKFKADYISLLIVFEHGYLGSAGILRSLLQTNLRSPI